MFNLTCKITTSGTLAGARGDMNKLLTVFTFLIISYKMKAQSLYKPWFSYENNICFTIDSSSNSIKINDFYDEKIYKKKRIKYKYQNEKLKIIWYSSQNLFGWKKDRYFLNVDKLTNDSLILTLLPNKYNSLDEIFQERTVKFIAIPNGCDSKWKKINSK